MCYCHSDTSGRNNHGMSASSRFSAIQHARALGATDMTHTYTDASDMESRNFCVAQRSTAMMSTSQFFVSFVFFMMSVGGAAVKLRSSLSSVVRAQNFQNYTPSAFCVCVCVTAFVCKLNCCDCCPHPSNYIEADCKRSSSNIRNSSSCRVQGDETPVAIFHACHVIFARL